MESSAAQIPSTTERLAPMPPSPGGESAQSGSASETARLTQLAELHRQGALNDGPRPNDKGHPKGWRTKKIVVQAVVGVLILVWAGPQVVEVVGAMIVDESPCTSLLAEHSQVQNAELEAAYGDIFDGNVLDKRSLEWKVLNDRRKMLEDQMDAEGCVYTSSNLGR